MLSTHSRTRAIRPSLVNRMFEIQNGQAIFLGDHWPSHSNNAIARGEAMNCHCLYSNVIPRFAARSACKRKPFANTAHPLWIKHLTEAVVQEEHGQETKSTIETPQRLNASKNRPPKIAPSVLQYAKHVRLQYRIGAVHLALRSRVTQSGHPNTPSHIRRWGGGGRGGGREVVCDGGPVRSR